MIRRLFMLLIIICSISKAYTQISITGSVQNTGREPLPFSTVALMDVADSTVFTYALTNNEGEYNLSYSKTGKYLLQARFLGYHPETKKIEITSERKNISLDFILSKNNLFLEEITVKGKNIGMQLSGDTLRYDPSVFADGTEETLGDLLNKLPGIEVDESGNITAQGKKVDKLMLNGQDFFGNSTQLATKNLDADIAESVEVLSNYSEFSLLKGFQSREQTAINIGVNKEKTNRISGNVKGGGGVEDKYNLKGNLMKLGSKSMVGFIGAVNNIGDEVFSFQDYIRLQGGIGELINNAGSNRIRLSTSEQKLILPQSNSFAHTNGLSALNYTYHPFQNLKINTYLLFNAQRSKAEDFKNYIYFQPNESEFETEKSLYQINNTNLTSGYLKVNYAPTETFSLGYKGIFSSSYMKEKGDIHDYSLKGKFSVGSKETSSPFSTNHEAVAMKKISNNLLLFNASLNYRNSPEYYKIATDSLLLPFPMLSYEDMYYGQQNKKGKSLNGILVSSFLYRINPSYFLKSSLSVKYDKDTYDTDFTYENKTYYNDDSLSNHLSTQNYEYTGSLNLIKNKGLVRFKLELAGNILRYKGNLSDIDNSTSFKFSPSAELSFHFSERHSLTTSFSRTFVPNSINYFTQNPIVRSYYSYLDKSEFQNVYSKEYAVNLYYSIFDLFSQTMFVILGSYNRKEDNPMSDYLQQQLISTSYYILSPAQENLSTSFSLSKGLGFLPWSLHLNGSYRNNIYHNRAYGIDNKIKIGTTNGTLQLSSNHKSFINFEIGANWNFTDNKIKIGNSTHQFIQRYNGKLKFNITEKLYAETGAEYVINNLPDENKYLFYLNGNIKYKFNKYFELDLQGRNILNLHKQEWISYIYRENYNLEHRYRQIPGNVMLSLNYSF